MATEWTHEEGTRVMDEAMKRAASDPAFRQTILSNPNKAIEQIAGKPVPADFKIRAIEKNGANVTLVLPDPVSPTGELSDTELEQVAGGGRCAGTCVASCGWSSVL